MKKVQFMKIIVLLKEVPDTYSDRKIDLETGLANRTVSDAVHDEISERALEVALSYADSHEGTEIELITVAPAGAQTTIRKGLAMGATRAIHIVDEQLIGADVTLTAEVLAATITRSTYDLVIAGNASTDGASGMVPAAIAELLNIALVSGLSHVEIAEHTVSGTRPTDHGAHTISAQLPALISITEALPDARFPNFKGIMAAKKKPLETLSLNDIGVDAERHSQARSIMLAVSEKPKRAVGVKLIDEGDAVEQLVNYLVEHHLV